MKRFLAPLAGLTACLALAAAAAAAGVATPTSGPLSKPPKVTPPSGAPTGKLVKIDLVKGTGVAVAAGDIVTINQVIARYSGKVVQSTWTTGHPITEGLAAAQVITGLIKGLKGAHLCGRRELIIPGKLADLPASNLPASKTTFIYIVDVLGVSSATGGAAHVCGANSKPS